MCNSTQSFSNLNPKTKGTSKIVSFPNKGSDQTPLNIKIYNEPNLSTQSNAKQMNDIINGEEANVQLDKFLEKYIDKMDRDQSDLRSDIKASEERIAKSIEQSEQRNEARMARIESILVRMEDKIDNLETRVHDQLTTNRHFNIANFVAMAALAIAVVIGLVQILQAIVK